MANLALPHKPNDDSEIQKATPHLTNTPWLERMPASVREIAKRILAYADTAGATTSQKQELKDMMNKIVNGKYELYERFQELSLTLKNPKIKPEDWGLIHAIVERTGNSKTPLAGLQDTLKSLNHIINYAYFTHDHLKLVEILYKKVGRVEDGLKLLDTVVSHPKFKPELLTKDFITELAELAALVSSHSNLLNSIENTTDIFANPNFDPQNLRLIKRILESVQGDLCYPAYFLKTIFANPNFNQDIFTDEFAGKLTDFLNFLYAKTRSQGLSEKYNASFYFSLYGNLFSNSNINPHQALDGGMVKKFMEFTEFAAQQIARADYDNQHEIAFDVLFDTIFKNPNFRFEMLDEKFAENIRKAVDAIRFRYKKGSKQKEVEWVMRAILSNPNFSPVQLDEQFTLKIIGFVEAIHAKAKYDMDISNLVAGLLGNPNFKVDDVLSAKYEEKIAGFLNFFLSSAKTGDPSTLLYHLGGVFSNPNFTPKMFDKLTIDEALVFAILNFGTGEDKKILQNRNFALERLRLVADVVNKSDDKKKALDNLDDTLDALGKGQVEVFWRLLELTNSQDQGPFDDFLKALNAIYDQGPFLSDTANIVNLFDNAKSLMDKLGIKANPEIRLNFIYGLAILGEEKTTKLYTEFGITYFGRYPKPVLESLYANLSVDSMRAKPLFMAVFNKNDWNGAFYYNDPLWDLLDKYRLIVVEVDSEKQFYDRVGWARSKYGPIDTLFVGGHGTSTGLQLGTADEQGRLDLSDYGEIRTRTTGCLGAKPTIILAACSTGAKREGRKVMFGEMLLRIWPDATIFAPEEPDALLDFHFNNKNRIDEVVYGFSGRKIKKER